LQAIADSFGEELLVNGVAYRLHEPGSDTYHGLCGPLEIKRPTHREVGVRNGPIVVAVELAARLVEGATPALAYSVAHGYAQHDMRAHKENLEAAHRVPPSRTTLERIATRLGAAAVDGATKIEPVVRRAERVPEGTVAVSNGLDRTSVPMMEDRPADAPPKPERKRLRPRQRRAPAPFDVNWRMGYVGTVSFVDALGESLRTVRYAAAACDDPRELVVQMTADVRSALKRQPDLKVGIVQDGAHQMWNRTREGLETLRSEGLLASWEEGIDRYHLLERIADAMAIVESDQEARKRKLDEWREGFDIQDSTIDRVEYFLRSATSWCPRTSAKLSGVIFASSAITRTACDTSHSGSRACRSEAASPRAHLQDGIRPSHQALRSAMASAHAASRASRCEPCSKANASPASGNDCRYATPPTSRPRERRDPRAIHAPEDGGS
jgi:hypothetical protein